MLIWIAVSCGKESDVLVAAYLISRNALKATVLVMVGKLENIVNHTFYLEDF